MGDVTDNAKAEAPYAVARYEPVPNMGALTTHQMM